MLIQGASVVKPSVVKPSVVKPSVVKPSVVNFLKFVTELVKRSKVSELLMKEIILEHML